MPEPGNSEDRQVAEEPGDIVDEHVAAAVQHGRPGDRVGQAGPPQVLLDQGFATVVGQGRPGGGVGYAHVHDSAHACATGCVDQPAAVFHCQVVRDPATGEANPVRVVQRVDAAERGRQDPGAFEVERESLDLRVLRMVRERADLASSGQEALGHAPAGIAEGARNYVDSRHRHRRYSHGQPELAPVVPRSAPTPSLWVTASTRYPYPALRSHDHLQFDFALAWMIK